MIKITSWVQCEQRKFSEFCSIKPNMDCKCNYTLSIDFAPNGDPFAAKINRKKSNYDTSFIQSEKNM